jgi:hypothetical protein
MDRLIPFPIFEWPGPSKAPADFFRRRGLVAACVIGVFTWSLAWPCGADADIERPQREPMFRPMRPANTEEFLARCKEDSLYCEEQFALYIQRYAAVRVEELAQRDEHRKLRENLRDPAAFDGICLPRDRLFSESLPAEMARGFTRWAERNRATYRERPPVGVKAAMRALYPCPP